MKCPICEQVIRKKLVVFQMIYFPRLQEDKVVCKKCYASFSEQDIYNELASFEEGMSLEEAMEFRRKRIKPIRPQMKCPICKNDYYDKLQGIVFQEKDYPELVKDSWICKICYTTYKEDAIIEKIRQPDPPKVFDEPVHKKSGMKEFFGWFFWGSATALAFGITFIGFTNLDEFEGLIFLVFGGGFLSACLAKLVKRIRTK